MTFHEFKDPVFGRAIARKFAVIHSLDVPINKHPNWLLDTLDLWAQTAIDYHTDPNNSLNIQNPKLETDLYAFDYKSELKWLRQLLTTCGSPPVFSHNDLSETNVLIPGNSTAYADGIVFIDFEWAHYNYRGFDIANYFTKFMFDFSTPEYPRVQCDHNAYPNDYEKRVFIREYIKHSKGLTCDKQTEDQVVKEADYFALSAHLLWALWCLNKCHSSGVRQFGVCIE
jgi:thiamine kinase-like enzyme